MTTFAAKWRLNTQLWRYITPNFIDDFLDNGHIPLIPLEILSDQSEGFPEGFSAECQQLAADLFADSLSIPYTARDMRVRDRRLAYVSSWCLPSGFDRAEMWRNYGSNQDPSLGVVCSEDALTISLQKYADNSYNQNYDLIKGPVTYIGRDEWNSPNLSQRIRKRLSSSQEQFSGAFLFVKRNELSYEHEFRFLIYDNTQRLFQVDCLPPPAVHKFPIEQSTVRRLVIGPCHDNARRDALEEKCRLKGWHVKIERSPLEPI